MDSVVFKRCQKRLIHPLRLRVLASWRFSDLTQRRRDAERCPRPHTCEGTDSDHRKRQNQEIFEVQTLTYLRLTGLKLGIVINFGERLVKDGIHRVVNGL
ncbi:MAG: hypothetical protein C5S47_07790 [Candidatus Methanogasteraceae archaeon]|nr:MAG: hypothetical protein C5S47_07790 [ANME-2 cluster archaeon]